MSIWEGQEWSRRAIQSAAFDRQLEAASSMSCFLRLCWSEARKAFSLMPADFVAGKPAFHKAETAGDEASPANLPSLGHLCK